MTPHQISLVQKTWALAEPLGDTVTVLFYGRLFELDPSLRRLFRQDMLSQGRNLRRMLAIVVRGLPQPESIRPMLEESGRRHVQYGVKSEHYDLVEQALLWTLQQGLREHFTPEVRDAWHAAYTLMAGFMLEAARDPASAEIA